LKAFIASGSPYSALLRIHHGRASRINGTKTSNSARIFGLRPVSEPLSLGDSQSAIAMVGRRASAEVFVSIARPAKPPTSRARFGVHPSRTPPRQTATVQVQRK